MGAAFEQLERGSSVLYGACGGVWVMTLFAMPTKEDMLLARSTLVTMQRQQPSGFATLTWVLPEAGYRMDQEARTAATDVAKEFDRSIRGQAPLIEGSGFQAATVRAIIAGLDVMSGSSATKKVFSDLAPAVAWCMERTPRRAPAAPVADLTQSLYTARASLLPRRA